MPSILRKAEQGTSFINNLTLWIIRFLGTMDNINSNGSNGNPNGNSSMINPSSANPSGGNPTDEKQAIINPNAKDLLVLLNNPSMSRLYADAFQRFKVNTVIEKEDSDIGKISVAYMTETPTLTLIGSKFFNKTSSQQYHAVRDSIFKWYVSRKACMKDNKNMIYIPVIVAQESAEMELSHPYAKINLKKLILPESSSVSNLDNLVNKDFRKILYELGIKMPAFDAPPKTDESKKPDEPKYNPKDFSAEYIKGQYKIIIKGPVVELSTNKLKACIEEKDTMAELKKNRILTLDWSGVTYVDDHRARELHGILKEYITRKDVSGNTALKEIQMSGFREKSAMIKNQNLLDFYNSNFKILS